MGVDAEIVIRNVPRSIVTDEWLKEISWRLVQSIGSKHFLLSDGLLPADYEKASKAWHKAFDAHPLYAEFSAEQDYTKRSMIHKRIFADIGEAPKCRTLAIEPTMTRYREKYDPPPGCVYRQDGDDVEAEDGECLLELSLMGRYYGIGYERGDILSYCAMAEWLESNIPGCVVYYGGDSSGICAEPFDAVAREAIKHHLYSQSGRDYFNRDNSFMGGGSKKPPACGLCPGNQYHGNQFGWGQNGKYAAFSCAGCGKDVKTNDGGTTWSADDSDK